MTSSSHVRRILSASSVVLLDFDGPVCAIFSAVTDVAVADRLREVLLDAGVEMDVPTRHTNDPLAVLQYAGTQADRGVLAKVETTLISAEIEAAKSASPTPSANQFIRSAVASGRSIGIVSNNSAEAVNAYLEQHELMRYVSTVVGRQPGRPDLMKPNRFPVYEALRQLSASPESAVLIGDAPTDLVAAHAAGIPCIWYEIVGRFEPLDDADARVGSMEELVAGL